MSYSIKLEKEKGLLGGWKTIHYLYYQNKFVGSIYHSIDGQVDMCVMLCDDKVVGITPEETENYLNRIFNESVC